ncbi:MAG: SIMPL domain-containing protein, partial [Hyphomicrobiales bacterium]|nr:SIMPL domain-containing protein [Hyphomicrobiales bacterium]
MENRRVKTQYLELSGAARAHLISRVRRKRQGLIGAGVARAIRKRKGAFLHHRRKSLIAIGLAASCLAGLRVAAQDRSLLEHAGHTISVTGRGTVKAEADVARITFWLSSEGSFAQDALAAQKLKTKHVVDALRGAGISESDIGIGIPQFAPRFSPGIVITPAAPPQAGASVSAAQPARTLAQQNGFRVTSLLTITTVELDNLGVLVDLVTDSADNRAPTITYSVSDSSSARDEARRKGFDDSERLAKLAAERAHVRLGQV